MPIPLIIFGAAVLFLMVAVCSVGIWMNLACTNAALSEDSLLANEPTDHEN